MHDSTRDLLERSHEGDQDARQALLDQNLTWIYQRVRKRLGPGLRARAETVDFVQDAAVKLLECGARFVVSTEQEFRGLMAHIIENVLRDKADYFQAQCRSMARERQLAPDSRLYLIDPPDGSTESPAELAERNELKEWLQLALWTLDPADRSIIWLHKWEGLTFGAAGKELGIQENAARMRYQRAMPRLQRAYEQLRSRDPELFEVGEF